MSALFDKNVDVLSKSLDLLLVRQSVTADNIANAETPYFKARRVDFENALQDAVDNQAYGFGNGVGDVTPDISQDLKSETGQDLNTVDTDREMAELTKTDVRYSAVTQAISRKMALLKYAITEGGDR